jgi:hypothetical protein
VLFLEVAPGPGRDVLQQVAGAALAHFRAAGLAHEDGKPFAPHVTIAKTSRLIGHKRHKSAAGAGSRREGRLTGACHLPAGLVWCLKRRVGGAKQGSSPSCLCPGVALATLTVRLRPLPLPGHHHYHGRGGALPKLPWVSEASAAMGRPAKDTAAASAGINGPEACKLLLPRQVHPLPR